ncbi:MAG: hypothetical protein IPK63_23750 [Candidatus Competibacteraceae bacterium]|nr:hypothetical protein [Candidatus Competibacteraceae bacterium]
MNYEFNSTLFDTPYRRDRVIAESWLYADGLNNEQEVLAHSRHRLTRTVGQRGVGGVGIREHGR